MVEPEQAIDRINGVFGRHPGHRALHAKGHFYTGTFTATPAATALCTAGHLQGEPVPVRVRWSNGGGNPKVPDTAPDVRGMAVSFRLADGTATDLLGQTAPRFPVRTPDDFVEFVEASKKQVTLPLFLLKHRSAFPALLANVKGKAIVPPRSYAEATYYPVHAYSWTAADGSSTWVRYRFTPRSSTAPEGSYDGADRLQEEIVARLAAGPVQYTLEVQRARPGEDPHDPMSVWQGDWFDAGTIEVTGTDPERETNGEIVVFDPTRVVPGIGLSDDPILHYRAAAYGESARRRMS
ncbi:MAG: catalase [Nocardioidaceae bacterium]|nr:catalase [Nocardioidaceae bacterium]